jgi:hypothetical protein
MTFARCRSVHSSPAVTVAHALPIDETYRRQQQARYDDQRRVTRILSRKGALRPGLSVKTATDIMWTIASPRTHHNLVSQRKWTSNAYEQWLADTLARTLLEPSE